ncbi:MAG: hypothetical protein ACLR1R_01650 [Ruminococcus callidus]
MEIGTLNQRITFLENQCLLPMKSAITPLCGTKHSSCWAKVTLKAASEAYGRWCDQRNTSTGIPHSAKS